MEGLGDPDMDSDSESETMSPTPSLGSASLHGKKNINRGRWNKEEVSVVSMQNFVALVLEHKKSFIHIFHPNFRMKNLKDLSKFMGNDGIS